MNRCTRCITPDTVPGVDLRDGICRFCRSYQEPQYLGEEKLVEEVEKARSAKSEYDCIVPLSGGRDSSFVLYFAKVDLGLKPLAVNFDNEFRTEQAIVNMQTICDRLAVPLQTIGSRRRIASKIVRSELRLAMPEGHLAIMSGLCTACTYGYHSTVYRTADQYGIPLILWGSSQSEDTQRMHAPTTPAPTSDVLGRLLGKCMRCVSADYCTLQFRKLMQRLEFPVAGNRVLSDSIPKRHHPANAEIRLFDYVQWDRDRIKKTIIDELGWEKPKDAKSTWRTDCRLGPLVNYCHLRSYGCTKACLGYCNMINAGQMTREEALRQEEEMVQSVEQEAAKVLKTDIGLPASQVEQVLA